MHQGKLRTRRYYTPHFLLLRVTFDVPLRNRRADGVTPGVIAGDFLHGGVIGSSPPKKGETK